MSGVPDYIGGIIAHLSDAQAIRDVSQEVVVTGQRKKVKPRSWGIVLTKSGGFGADQYVPFVTVRVDMKFFGPNELSCMNLWRASHAVLQPPDRRSGAFTAAGCRFLDAQLEGGPVELVDPSDDSPHVLVPYRFLISEVAVA